MGKRRVFGPINQPLIRFMNFMEGLGIAAQVRMMFFGLSSESLFNIGFTVGINEILHIDFQLNQHIGSDRRTGHGSRYEAIDRNIRG